MMFLPTWYDAWPELGLLGMTLPTEWGRLGWNMVQQAADDAVHPKPPAFTEHGSRRRSAWLSEQRPHLPCMAAGECVTAFALTEPEAGPDAGAVGTIARLAQHHYVLNGQKRFVPTPTTPIS
ncbi:hypothetical protein [Saccharopolyspora shandongensis]|uniref:hypothetical protein n=1 Tax=Saccharopolyspora shandongensis TaxID=418495 RepID=UPI0033CC5594